MLLPASLVAGIGVWRATGRLKRGEHAPEWAPFASAVAIYVLAFLGLAYSLFPYVVMDRLTICEAAAHPSSLKAVLAVALVVLPFIVAYTAFSYRVFWGKGGSGSGE